MLSSTKIHGTCSCSKPQGPCWHRTLSNSPWHTEKPTPVQWMQLSLHMQRRYREKGGRQHLRKESNGWTDTVVGKVPTVQAQGFAFKSQYPRWKWRPGVAMCICDTVLRLQKQVDPWGLLGCQLCLLSKLLPCEKLHVHPTPTLPPKKGRKGVENVRGTTPGQSSTHTQPETHVYLH